MSEIACQLQENIEYVQWLETESTMAPRLQAAKVPAGGITPGLPRLIECEGGVRTEAIDAHNSFICFWVKSPKTGNVISIHDAWWGDLPPRVIATARAAAEAGEGTIKVTLDELRQIASTKNHINEKCRSTEPYFGRRADGSYKPGRRRR